MLKLDWNLLWTVVNLLVLFLLLKKFLFGPVCKIMDERSAAIQKDLDDAAASKKDAEQMKTDYEAQIKDAHKEAASITASARERAGKESEVILENAREESAKLIKQAEASIANDKDKALNDAKYQIADLAILAAAKVIKKNVGDESDKKVAEDFLSEVGVSK